MAQKEIDELNKKAKKLALDGVWTEESHIINTMIIERDPKSIEARTRLAKYYRLHGSLGRAESLYIEVLTIDPSHFGARNRLSELSQEKEKQRAQYNIRSMPHKNIITAREERDKIEHIIEYLIYKAKDKLHSYPNMESVDNIFKKHNKSNFNYNDHNEQLFYLLRYFYAYYYEYRVLLQHISQYMDELSVCSIGSGSCIDGLALYYAASLESREYKYIGIDLVDWYDRQGIIDNNNDALKFIDLRINEDSADYLRDASILFFPKSLSDISKEDMQDIHYWITKSKIRKKKICIAASFTDSNENTKNEYNLIIRLFLKKGYTITVSYVLPLSEAKISESSPDCLEPTGLLRFFREDMELLCNKYREKSVHCGHCLKEKHTGRPWFMQPRLTFSPYNRITFMKLGDE